MSATFGTTSVGESGWFAGGGGAGSYPGAQEMLNMMAAKAAADVVGTMAQSLNKMELPILVAVVVLVALAVLVSL